MKKLIFILLSLLLFSCNKLKEGHVTGKHYEPGQFYTYTTFIVSGNTTVPITNVGYDAEDFILEVKGVYQGEERIEHWYVDRELYDSIKVNAFICKDGRCNTEDSNNH